MEVSRLTSTKNYGRTSGSATKFHLPTKSHFAIRRRAGILAQLSVIFIVLWTNHPYLFPGSLSVMSK